MVVVLGLAISLAASSVSVASRAEGRVFELTAVPPRAVLIVPGAGVFADGTPSAVLQDRLVCARDLYRAGRARRVLVSGDHGARSHDETSAMQRWLVAQGVPVEAIDLDHSGFRTLDTMARAARVFGVGGAIVCSQRVYLDRAVFLARAFGIDAVGAIADAREYEGRHLAAVREAVARLAAVVDVYVLHRGPRVRD